MINSNCITDTDLVHISRDRQDYKITFEQLQYDVTDFGHLPKLPCEEGAPDGSMPWDDIPFGCGRFHIKNITIADVYFKDKRGPIGKGNGIQRLYTMDGRRVPMPDYVTEGEWIYIADGDRAFKSSDGNWEFGELTDTSRLIYVYKLFATCPNFDQDLSDWCVPLIKDPELYEDCFFECPNMENNPEKQPVWGTCPGGKNS